MNNDNKNKQERINYIENEILNLNKRANEFYNLSDLLENLKMKSKHDIMVPFGNVACTYGQIIDTNKIIVALNDEYYCEKNNQETIEYCERKAQQCKLACDDLERQIHILNGRLNIVKREDGENEYVINEYEENDHISNNSNKLNNIKEEEEEEEEKDDDNNEKKKKKERNENKAFSGTIIERQSSIKTITTTNTVNSNNMSNENKSKKKKKSLFAQRLKK